MDDPLRPKTVPLSAETILWFEFLLDPSLLTTHLNKSIPDPSPIDLISQFIAMSPDHQIAQYDITGSEIEPIAPVPAENNLRLGRKQLALKILTLKVATHLKWNLDIIEKHLPVQKQIFLFRDLCTIAFGKAIIIPLPNDFDSKIAPEGSEKAAKFGLTLYHRWVLRTQILKELAIKAAKPMLHMLMTPEPINPIAPDIPVQPSIDFLTKLLENSASEAFHIFTFDMLTAIHSNSEKTEQDFNRMPAISSAELKTQIYYDLTGFYLFSKQYELARQSVIECRKNLMELKHEYSRKCLVSYMYCHLDEAELEGYLLACGVSNVPETLLAKMNYSLLNQYRDIEVILKEDNIQREIPIVSRRIIELDIEGAIANGQKLPKELEMNVAALNVIRGTFEADNVFNSVDYMKKYRTMEPFAAIVEGVRDVLPHCNFKERNKIKQLVIEQILVNKENKKMLKLAESLGIFSAIEIEDLKRQTTEEEIILPPLATHMDWKWSSKNSRIEIGSWERQLISCTNATTVRKVLVKLAPSNPSKPLWTINPSWQIPIPIKSLLMSFQRGFLQDFAYVLLGKSREMASKNDFVGAVSMLSVLKSELQRPELSSAAPVAKFAKLVTWEILYIQICQSFEEWHTKPLDFNSLATRCKQCLSSVQNGDNVIPRIEIIEHCAMVLLNLNDWNALMFLDKRLTSLEMPIAFAATFLEMEKLKTTKKIPRDAWDIVLVMFSTAQQKRGGGGGGGGGNSRNSPSLAGQSSLYPFLKKIREPKVFTLAISLLAKIHNILKDDPNFDLNGDYMNLWPASISNPVGYNSRPVAEILNWLLIQALQYYPQNTNWLKIKGDLELAIGNNEAAMRCYVNALVTGTEYFSLPLQRPIIDDYIIRKMIKCASNLDCYMQAGILCQFLDEIDYGLAFKNISEKSCNFADAMDAYYGCIWDPTLLEFIVHLHNKKGEHNKKLEAISVMSSLELNANNNEEIKREAAAIRKMRFLKALANQYL